MHQFSSWRTEKIHETCTRWSWDFQRKSRNYEDNVKRLIDVKHQLETESIPNITKVLKKYEKRLMKVVDFSSSSESDIDN
jgi:hypothetical protein